MSAYRVEFWVQEGWLMVNDALDLDDPLEYVTGCQERGAICRVFASDTGEKTQTVDRPEVYQARSRQMCTFCDTVHYAPFSGECLI